MLDPWLYLWNRLNTRSAGHGAYRGGLRHEFAWTLHGAAEVTQTVFAPNSQVSADGFGGGLPGGGSGHAIARGTNVEELFEQGTVPSESTLTESTRQVFEINQQDVMVRTGDVFQQWVAGGGGYGDPLLRDAQRVARDVADGYVSEEVAMLVYGVVLVDSDVDVEATRERRETLRAERLDGRTPMRSVDEQDDARASAPRRDDDGWYCPASGARLSTAEDWRSDVIVNTSKAVQRLDDLGVRVRRREQTPAVLIDEFISPECGTLLEARIRVETVDEVSA